MTQFYSDELRESDAYALPNCEVFYRDGEHHPNDDCWVDCDGCPLPAGWYYWYCFPGCMPDSDPIGPFDTEEAAIEDARDNAA